MRWTKWLPALLACSAAPCALACNDIPEQLEKLLAPERVLLFGEIHGTREIPQRFLSAVCAASKQDLRVKVGLEFPHQLNDQLRAWYDSDGTLAAQAPFFQSEFWQRDYQDGRGSDAMLDLFISLRRDLPDVEVFLFDQKLAPRDRGMAELVIRQIEPDTLLMLLSGNIHSRTRNGAPWDDNFETMGAVIKERHPDTVSINLRPESGNAWICAPDCGKRTLGKSAKMTDEQFVASDGDDHHDWVWPLNEASASTPAKDKADD